MGVRMHSSFHVCPVPSASTIKVLGRLASDYVPATSSLRHVTVTASDPLGPGLPIGDTTVSARTLMIFPRLGVTENRPVRENQL